MRWCSGNSVLFHNIFSDVFSTGSGSGSEDFNIKINNNSYFVFQRYLRNPVLFRKVFIKFNTRSASGSGSWFYFGFQYQTYISYIEDTHQISFRKLLCLQPGSTYVQPDNQTDIQTDIETHRKTGGQTEIFFFSFYRPRHTKHEHLFLSAFYLLFYYLITFLYIFLSPKASFVFMKKIYVFWDFYIRTRKMMWNVQKNSSEKMNYRYTNRIK